MALFVCVWADESSLLVDVPDEATARQAGFEEVGEVPVAVRPFPPNVLGARVQFEEDEDGDEIVTLVPLAHVVELLVRIEDEATPEEDLASCPAEAEADDGTTLRCELGAGHARLEHRAGDFVW